MMEISLQQLLQIIDFNILHVRIIMCDMQNDVNEEYHIPVLSRSFDRYFSMLIFAYTHVNSDVSCVLFHERYTAPIFMLDYCDFIIIKNRYICTTVQRSLVRVVRSWLNLSCQRLVSTVENDSVSELFSLIIVFLEQ